MAPPAWPQQSVATASLPDAPGMGASSAQQGVNKQSPGSVSGVVMDPSGALVQDAHVTLAQAAPGPSAGGPVQLETVTNSEGRFNIANVPPGVFNLMISATGFAPLNLSGILHPGENYEPPAITLVVASNKSNVDVSVSRQELALYEVKAEEKQRVLGFIPNFYVSYVPNPVPLTPGQKFELAWRLPFDPVSWVGTAASAGIEQAANTFKGYGQGAQGYAKRYGATFTDSVSNSMIGGFILPSLLKQDPRYFYKGTGTVKSRILYALEFSVRCKGDNGKWQFNYSGILGGMAAGGVSNLYYPASDRNGIGLTFENAGLSIAGAAVGNLFQEFLVKRLTPRIPKYDEPTGP